MLTEEQIEKLKEANPGAELTSQFFDAIDVEIVFKVPDEGEWKRFLTEAQNEARRMLAVRLVVFGHVVFPDKAEFAALVGRKPGIVTNIFEKIADAAGASLESTVRKL